MRILLLQVNESEGGIMPLCLRPLALESLAAHLEEHQVQIVDLRLDERPLAEHLVRLDPQLIGVTCTFTCGLYPTQRLLRELRQLAPQAEIVVGGVHAATMPGDFCYPLADYLVRGPGERTLARLAQVLEAGGDPRQVPGLIVLDQDGSAGAGPLPSEGSWSASYRAPARQLTARYHAHYTPGPTGEPMIYMVSSRGCPFRCKFCSAWRIQGGKLDTRQPQCIYDEVAGSAAPWIYFFDDNSLANRKVMRQLADMLARDGIAKSYQMWVSADIICQDPELLRLWRQVGLRRIFTGLESIGGEFLARMGKRARPAQNLRAIEICRELDIVLSPTFIVDPGFAPEDFDRLAEFVAEQQLHLPYFFILTPLPGTELFEELAPQLTESHPGRFDFFHLVLPTSQLDPAEFLARYVELYLGCPSWQQGAAQAPVYATLLDNLKTLRSAPLTLRPVAGLDPRMSAFPRAA